MTGKSLIEAAFDKMDQAQDALLILALQLQGGATRQQIGRDADAQIRDTLRRMHEARYEADAALCSAMRGEPYQPRPTQPAQGVEMQARMDRNERSASLARAMRLPDDAGFGSFGSVA